MHTELKTISGFINCQRHTGMVTRQNRNPPRFIDMDVKEIHIEKCVHGGYGLGFIQGKAVFVPYGLPGDELLISVIVEKKDFSYGTINEINRSSPLRIDPECPNFSKCGGCDYLHCSYDTELMIKKSVLLENLRRVARIPERDIPSIEIIAGERYNYRSIADIKCDVSGKPGFYRRDSRIHVPFPEGGCLLLSPALQKELYSMKKPGVNGFRIAEDCHHKVYTSDLRGAVIKEKEQGIIFERSMRCFFQANRRLRSSLLETAGRFIGPGAGGSLLDLACGVGFFSLYLAQKGYRGLGIDIDRESIRWATGNAKLNRITSIDFKSGDAARALSWLRKPDVVITDPPRQGLSPGVRTMLKSMAPGKMVHVSCNPATFCRDIAYFRSAGFRLTGLAMIDMFPGTHHMEVMCRLEQPD